MWILFVDKSFRAFTPEWPRRLLLLTSRKIPFYNSFFAAMKTLRLDLDYEYDFEIYGIVSSSKEYTLAWALNKYFNFRLIKQKDLCFDFISKGRLVISNYLHTTDHYTIRLFRNKSVDLTTLKKPYLVPDIKEYDYVVQISGALTNMDTQELLKKLNLLPLVQYVKRFDPNTLQFKDNLIF